MSKLKITLLILAIAVTFVLLVKKFSVDKVVGSDGRVKNNSDSDAGDQTAPVLSDPVIGILDGDITKANVMPSHKRVGKVIPNFAPTDTDLVNVYRDDATRKTPNGFEWMKARVEEGYMYRDMNPNGNPPIKFVL